MANIYDVENKYVNGLMEEKRTVTEKDINALAAFHKSIASEKEVLLNHDAAMTSSFVELTKAVLTCAVSVCGIAASAALVNSCTKYEETGTYTTTAGSTALRNLTSRLFKW